MTLSTSIYIHWPFCRSKCPYCDFNSHVATQIDHEIWAEAYIKQLNYFDYYLQGKEIKTIFFGGGTPSLANTSVFNRVLQHIYHQYKVQKDVEITIEANPTSIEMSKFKELKAAGINRVSIGVQSLQEERLKFLGREHSLTDALRAIEIAADTFDEYSFDLIYATPNQSLEDWQRELQAALKLVRNHISLYQLTIEKGTKFFSAFKKKQFVMPSDDLSALMFELTTEECNQFGLNQYEISNFATKGYESKHNMAYWEYNDYLGIGPGAHSRITIDGKKKAIQMISDPKAWLESASSSKNGIQQYNTLTKTEEREEAILMGLRIKQGVDINIVVDSESAKSRLEHLVEIGMLKIQSNKVVPTKNGQLLCNQIIKTLCA